MLDVVGEDNVMIEMDYPHSDTTWPHSIKLAHERLNAADLSRRGAVQDPPGQRREAVPLHADGPADRLTHRVPSGWPVPRAGGTDRRPGRPPGHSQGARVGGTVDVTEPSGSTSTRRSSRTCTTGLVRTRLADEPDGAGWDYGTSAGYLAELVAYWRDEFDWFAAQDRLNALPQFTALVDGVDLHFAHLRGRGPTRCPILLVHGWPSGYLEMTKLAPLLADPAAAGATRPTPST